MTQIQFTLNMDKLKDSIMNSNIEAVTKSTIVLILNEYMEKERDEYLNNKPYERGTGSRDYRNGYYTRSLMLEVGKVELHVPRTRDGGFSPTVFEKHQRCDQAFMMSMLEMVVNGVSTRKVKNIVEQLCGEAVSKSFVSSLTDKLDPVVNQWAKRSLNTMFYPYIFVDAMYIKVREHHKVVPKAVYIATAINEDNHREILGFMVNHEESFQAWQTFFQDLIHRGLQSPRLIISDAHSGLKQAIAKTFIGTSWQRCTVHFKRNIKDSLPKKGMSDVMTDLKRIFNTSRPEDARMFKEDFTEKYADNTKLTKAIEKLEEGFDEATQYLNEPVKYHRFIHSTNSLERLNQEVRRRERVIRIFPNTQSAFRLIGAVLMDEAEKQKQKKNIIGVPNHTKKK